MTCEEGQQLILAADNLQDPTQFTPELRAHLESCPQCQKFLAQLVRIEAAAGMLPLPAAAREPSAEFLSRVEKISASRRPFARVWVRRAIAAAVVIAVGLAAASVLTESKPARADEIFKQLIDWNLRISSSHDPANRSRLYAEKAQQLQKEVDAARLAPEDRAVAVHLLANAKQLTATENPAQESKDFSQIADELLARQKAPSNAPIAHQLEQLRLDLVNHAVTPPPSATTPSQQPSSKEEPTTTPILRTPAIYQVAPESSPTRSMIASNSFAAPLLKPTYTVSAGAFPGYLSHSSTILFPPSLPANLLTKAELAAASSGKMDFNATSLNAANAPANSPNDRTYQPNANAKSSYMPNDLSTAAAITAPAGRQTTAAAAFDNSTPTLLALLTNLAKPSSSSSDTAKYLAAITLAASQPDTDDALDSYTASALRSLNQGHSTPTMGDGDGDVDDMLSLPAAVLRALPDLISPADLALLDTDLPMLQHIIQSGGPMPSASAAVGTPAIVPEPCSLLLLGVVWGFRC